MGFVDMEKFDSYAWDQTTKAVTIYVPYQGATADDVEHAFSERAFELRVRVSPTTCRELKIVNLCKPINVDKSKVLVKPDRAFATRLPGHRTFAGIQLKLVKQENHEWSALDDEIDRKAQARAKRVEHGDLKDASTQELLADMYANATDEERASLRSAAATGAKKREENAKKNPSSGEVDDGPR
ncbi:hypothetical protein CTAYLR_005931 [Chrysophaeum taylorii]|uniref:CS domain-containing protein n=1 Tax=Chrysophaeum taylorii TaxID=2483200 RepID=A0AAD7XMK1_9STRA|nr:hypothetical protein CTAYLR_005931 [Chrysophaeum taylorii]